MGRRPGEKIGKGVGRGWMEEMEEERSKGEMEEKYVGRKDWRGEREGMRKGAVRGK